MLLQKFWVVALLLALVAPAADARERTAVWFAPDGGTPDYTDLFSRPQLWAKARGQVDVIKFYPNQVDAKSSKPNSFADLDRVGAFRKLAQWDIAIAIEAPAIKEWDCSGQGDVQHDPRVRGDARAATFSYIKTVAAGGAQVKFIAMDEPLVSGLGPCHETMDQVAAKTAAYAKALQTSPDTADRAPGLEIGDIEPYPSKSVDQLKAWTETLERNGFRPAFFHLDVDVHNVDIHGATLPFASDMRALQSYFRAKGIPFGVVFWSGYDPEPSDASYFNHVVAYARRVHAAIGAPDQTILQSWVRRSSVQCAQGVHCGQKNNYLCSPADPPYCGKSSVPINLPENNPDLFSHTRLIDAVIGILHPERRAAFPAP